MESYLTSTVSKSVSDFVTVTPLPKLMVPDALYGKPASAQTLPAESIAKGPISPKVPERAHCGAPEASYFTNNPL